MGKINVGPVAKSVPFDNSTNGFNSNNTQTAIEEAKNSLSYYYQKFNGTVTTTSTSFVAMSTLTVTPVAGTYVCIYSTNIATTNGANNRVRTCWYFNGAQVSNTTKETRIQVALLLGLIGTAITTEGASNSIHLQTFNGSQSIQVRYASPDGTTVSATNGSLLLIRVA